MHINKNVIEFSLVAYNIDVFFYYDMGHFHLRVGPNFSPMAKAEEFRESHILYVMHLHNMVTNNKKGIEVTTNALRRMRTEYK